MTDQVNKSAKVTRERSRQWDCPSHMELKGHEEDLRRCRWKGTLTTSGGLRLRFWAEFFEIDPAKVVTLENVLFDTSDHYEGTIVHKRFTWHEEAICINCNIFVVPFDGKSVVPPLPGVSADQQDLRAATQGD